MKKSNQKKPRVISLFAGCGGLDIGFHLQGYEVVWANDFDECAATTYKHNLGDAMVCKDIEKINPYKDKSIPASDLIIGGFPCQDFSIIWKRPGLN
ncbi:MAG: DNA cytosine methyltransferase, partial [Nitrospirota bacterium]